MKRARLGRGTEKILLVEDEPSLRGALRETLEGKGYRALVAGEGAAALRVADEQAGPIHLLLTDVIMPGMTGRQAAEQLAAKRPRMKVLYFSGYDQQAIARHGEFGPGMAFLRTLSTLASPPEAGRPCASRPSRRLGRAFLFARASATVRIHRRAAPAHARQETARQREAARLLAGA